MDFSLISNNRISITAVTVSRRRVINISYLSAYFYLDKAISTGRLFTRVLCECLRMRRPFFFFSFAEKYTLRMARGLGKACHVSCRRMSGECRKYELPKCGWRSAALQSSVRVVPLAQLHLQTPTITARRSALTVYFRRLRSDRRQTGVLTPQISNLIEITYLRN